MAVIRDSSPSMWTTQEQAEKHIFLRLARDSLSLVQSRSLGSTSQPYEYIGFWRTCTCLLPLVYFPAAWLCIVFDIYVNR
jgi:hypothetical protein